MLWYHFSEALFTFDVVCLFFISIAHEKVDPLDRFKEFQRRLDESVRVMNIHIVIMLLLPKVTKYNKRDILSARFILR